MTEYYNCESCNEINPKRWGTKQTCKKCKVVQGQKTKADELVGGVVEALQEIRLTLEAQNQLLDYIASTLTPLPLPEPTPEEEPPKKK